MPTVQVRGEQMVVVGADVDALYPSLSAEHVASICREAVLESEVIFEGVDYKEAAQYLALNYTR